MPRSSVARLACRQGVDRIMLMDTYTSSFEHFETSLSKAIAIIGTGKLGVG
jgi:hypothetical protein